MGSTHLTDALLRHGVLHVSIGTLTSMSCSTFCLPEAASFNYLSCIPSDVQLSVGSVRSKNAKNIVLKNLLDACFGAICFYLLGYGFAYGGANGKGNSFMSWGPFALKHEDQSAFYSWFFQFAVCCYHYLLVSASL
jgi:hypothetical protein